ncbi:MAG: alpha-hydroxy-acid oxidizing protein [Euryarchaeota archaeon]
MKYLCSNCKMFRYDEDKGNKKTGLLPGTKVEDIPHSWKCPVCGVSKSYLEPLHKKISKELSTKDLSYYRDIAREMLTGFCGVYPVCDGNPDHTCTGQKYGAAIGLGGAGQAKTFEANYKALQQYRLKMRVIKAHHEPEMSLSFLGNDLSIPVMGAPLSGVKSSLKDAIPEDDFYWGLLKGAQSSGTLGMVGNTPSSPEDLGVKVTGKNLGWGIPFFKPQSQERLIKLFEVAEKLDVVATGVDLDGAGSTYWVTSDKRVYRKSEAEIQELVDSTEKPVIFKGIMNSEDALKVLDSGGSACYVSNHGGRVLDSGQGVAEVLPDISKEISGKIPVLADGAVRTGFDVLKVLALGADVALIGRPLARMSIAGGEKAVKMYFDYVKDDLRRAMILTGCDSLPDAKKSILDKLEHHY